MFNLSRWRPRQLVFAWSAYWVSLGLITLGPAIAAILRMSAPGGKGSVNGSITDGVFSLSVVRDGANLWHGSAGLLSIAAWVAGPPIALFLLWLARRPSSDAALLHGDEDRAKGVESGSPAAVLLKEPTPEVAGLRRPRERAAPDQGTGGRHVTPL
jgi:hypothetical protein